MKIDYHMHFEHGSYDFDWVEGFFKTAQERGLDEIGITEHTHTFPEFKDLYYESLTVDDSPLGLFQQKWLTKNKFKYTLDEYFTFMRELQKRGKRVKIGIEVCNFTDQEKVRKILAAYPFDYIVGSVHYLNGWGYDLQDPKDWEGRDLEKIYDAYATEAEKLAASGNYDIMGHPFNIRLFKILPDGKFDETPYLKRVAAALKKAGMAVDINTGTRYRYPIAEISPYPAFLKIAYESGLPIITSSDAHEPEHVGNYIDEAITYAKSIGYKEVLTFDKRKPLSVLLG